MDRRVWISLGLVMALALILAGYYAVHKPVTLAQSLALVSVLADASVAALLTLACGGLGRRLARGEDIASPGARIALQAALGWGVMGLAMLALGLVNLYYPALIWIAVLLALGVFGRDAREWLVDLARAVRAMWLTGGLIGWASLFVWLTLVLGLLRALAPPLMWDALAYHLTLPKLYAQAHGVRIDADILFSGMPQITEMLYTAATLMRGAMAAQTLGWCFGFILALGLAAHTAELLGDRAGVLAPAILFSALTIAYELGWAYADLLLMLIALALLIALRQWQSILLSGVLAGLAMGCKYTAVLIPLAAVGVISLYSGVQKWGARIRQVAAFGAVVFAVFAPWLIKNWLVAGSPVYPLLIPAGYMDHLRQWFYSRPDTGERNPLWAALIFFRAVFLGVQSGNDYDATLGPLFVFLLLALAVGWRGLGVRIRRELVVLIVFALMGYAGWVALVFFSNLAWQVRLFFALFPVLAILCAGGLRSITSLDTSTLRASVVVNAAVALILALTALENLSSFAAHSPLAFLFGAQSAADYRASNLGAYALATDQVNALPAGSRIKFLWESRSLECSASVRCEPDVVIDRWWHLRRSVGATEAILARWKAEGVTHVLIQDAGVSFVQSQRDAAFVDSDWRELDALRSRLRPTWEIRGAYSLYELP